MYRKENPDQLVIEDFFLPFGGKLQTDNRWVKMAEVMPWELIETIYLKSIDEEKGRCACSARLAYGAIFIKEHEGLTDDTGKAKSQAGKPNRNTSKKNFNRFCRPRD